MGMHFGYLAVLGAFTYLNFLDSPLAADG